MRFEKWILIACVGALLGGAVYAIGWRGWWPSSRPLCKSTANRCWAYGYLWTRDVLVAVANENYLGRRGTRLKFDCRPPDLGWLCHEGEGGPSQLVPHGDRSPPFSIPEVPFRGRQLPRALTGL